LFVCLRGCLPVQGGVGVEDLGLWVVKDFEDEAWFFGDFFGGT
jgi:hypothetical protein